MNRSNNKKTTPYKYSVDDDDDMCDRRGGASRAGNLKDYRDEQTKEEIEEFRESTYRDDEEAAHGTEKRLTPHCVAHRRRQEQQQQREEEVFIWHEEQALELAPRADGAVAGAFAVGQGGQEVRRGRDTDNITLMTAPETVSSADNDDDPPALVEAHLAEPREDDENVRAQVTQMQQEIARLQQLVPTTRQAEAAQVVLTVSNGEEQNAESVDNNEEIGSKRRRRKLLVVFGAVVLVVAAILGAIVGVMSGGGGGESTNHASTGATTTPATTVAPTPAATAVAPATPASTVAPTTPAPSPIALLPNSPWNPVGQVLHGKAARDHFGDSVSLSRNGSIMAVGAGQGGASYNPGRVFVYRYNPTTQQWTQLGQELIGQAGGDDFGEYLSLNGDGNVLAVGADGNDSGGSAAGHVRVFEYDSASDRWVQLGGDILGQAAYDAFGVSVSLSDAGDILAVGAYLDDTKNGKNSGSVGLFQYDRGTSSWKQLGQNLIGEASEDRFGVSVSLSQSGTIVGIGAYWNDSGGNHAGQLSVYEYNFVSSRWDLLGSPMNGQVVNGYFGQSVSLDDSGLIMAVGAPGDEGERLLVYSYDRSESRWNQRGQTLLTQQPSNAFGWSVSLSGNGNVLAVGSDSHDGNGLTNAGQLRIFQHDINANEWKQVGDPINGEAEDDYFGNSVSLSADGSVVGVGAHRTDANGSDSGSAYAFTVYYNN